MEFDGEGEHGDDGNGGGTADLHCFDGIPGGCYVGDGDVDGLVGEEELIENGEGASGVFDCLESHCLLSIFFFQLILGWRMEGRVGLRWEMRKIIAQFAHPIHYQKAPLSDSYRLGS